MHQKFIQDHEAARQILAWMEPSDGPNPLNHPRESFSTSIVAIGVQGGMSTERDGVNGMLSDFFLSIFHIKSTIRQISRSGLKFNLWAEKK